MKINLYLQFYNPEKVVEINITYQLKNIITDGKFTKDILRPPSNFEGHSKFNYGIDTSNLQDLLSSEIL